MLLVTLGVVSAATLVVSGSLAVVGNVAYWLEHEANCRRRAAREPGAQSVPSSPAVPFAPLAPVAPFAPSPPRAPPLPLSLPGSSAPL